MRERESARRVIECEGKMHGTARVAESCEMHRDLTCLGVWLVNKVDL